MQKNQDLFGAAIAISTNALKIGYKELKKILEERIEASSSYSRDASFRR